MFRDCVYSGSVGCFSNPMYVLYISQLTVFCRFHKVCHGWGRSLHLWLGQNKNGDDTSECNITTDYLHYLFLGKCHYNSFNTNCRIGSQTICDVANFARRPRLLKSDFQWAQRKCVQLCTYIIRRCTTQAHKYSTVGSPRKNRREL